MIAIVKTNKPHIALRVSVEKLDAFQYPADLEPSVEVLEPSYIEVVHALRSVLAHDCHELLEDAK